VPETLKGFEAVGTLISGVEEQFASIDFKEYFANELEKLEGLHASYFRGGVDPSGNAWQPLAPATIRKKGHSVPMIHTRRLDKSLTEGKEGIRIVEDHNILFGTWVPYSIIHDTANEEKNRPARQHIGMNQEYLNDMSQRASEFAVKTLATEK